MSTDLLAEFSDSLDALGVGVTRTTDADAREAIADAIRGETVGSGLPDDLLPDGVTCQPTLDELERARTGVTAVPLAVAAYGTVVVTPTPAMEGSVSLFPPRHVAVLRASDLVPDVASALTRLESEFAAGNDAVFVTGVSSTADMGELVEGVHGPTEMHVVVIR